MLDNKKEIKCSISNKPRNLFIKYTPLFTLYVCDKHF